MSLQQINLYTDAHRPKREPLMALQLLWISGAAVLVFVLFSALTLWQRAELSDQLTALESRYQALNGELNSLRQQKPRAISAELQQEVAELETQLQHRQQLRDLIETQNLGNAAGFSGQLTSMAEQASSDLSLQQFKLSDGGQYVEFRGWVREAQRVPSYVQALRQSEAFAKSRFGVMTVSKSDKRSDAMRFSVVQAADDAGQEVGAR